MKKILAILTVATFLGGIAGTVVAGPTEDKMAFQKFYTDKFPDTPFADFANGVYAIHTPSREQWEAIEEFPPYELSIEKGERLFKKPFKNGKTYADCFRNGGVGIAQDYPHYDEKRAMVVTLNLAINDCRKANGEEPLDYAKGPLVDIQAYMSYTSRGSKVDVKVETPGARKAYEDGKKYYYTRRGQLNLSCAHCHLDNVGKWIRADLLGPALGHTTHMPIYRSKWGGMGSLHRRIGGCNKQVRAKPAKPQSEALRNLEFFLTSMGNGLPLNGPGARK